MFKILLLRVSTLAGPGAEVGGQNYHFPDNNIFLVFCPYDANKVQVASEECECSEQDSLRCQLGETCVKPPVDTGVEDTGIGGTDDVSSNTNVWYLSGIVSSTVFKSTTTSSWRS